MAGSFFEITSTLNSHIDTLITWLTILALIYIVAKYSLKVLREEALSQGFYLSVVYAIEVTVAAGILWGLPYYLEKKLQLNGLTGIVLWVELLGLGVLYFTKRKQAKKRGVKSFLVLYALLILSWLVDRWIGMFAIALPMIAIYYHLTYHTALAVMPASDVKNKAETQNRVSSFLAYMWGLQLPFWKAASNTENDIEKRIDGTPSFKWIKGLVWTYSHQVTGIAKGPNFDAKGPGLFFVDKSEQPFEIVDLRNLSRSSIIKAISQDGIPFEANTFVSFCIDRETWTRKQHLEFRRVNLSQGKEPDTNLEGAFPYSRARVKAALSLRSKRSNGSSEEITERWDDHVLAMAETAAREILSERSIEELWTVRINENNSATEEITSQIKSLLDESLRKMGIRLLAAKVSSYSFKDERGIEKEDEIVNLKLSAWSMEWEKHRALSLADGKAEADRIQQDARTYAHSVLLTAIADGLNQTRALHPNLPRYVIALRFIGALEKLLEEQSGEDEKESQQARANLVHTRERLMSKPGKD